MKMDRIREHALGGLAALGVSAGAVVDLHAAILHVDRRFSRLICALGHEFGLRGAELDTRACAILYGFAAIQVADDLADGDCDYLSDATKTGPGTQWILQHLFYQALLRSDVSREDLVLAAHDLVAVGAAQQEEVRTVQWNYDRAVAAAVGLNGSQYSAYFRILCSGTERVAVAPKLGTEFGVALHVITDMTSRDNRWLHLAEAEREQLRMRAKRAVEHVEQFHFESLREPLAWFSAVLRTQVSLQKP